MPWWDAVARGDTPADRPALTAADGEFAVILKGLTKVVFSKTLQSSDDRVAISGDIAAEMAALKRRDGKNVILSCGPATLAPLIATPRLIDEYLVDVHPAVIHAGPQLFQDASADLALELLEGKVFDAGCVVHRYASGFATLAARPSRLER